jgi:hypothetical protein
MVWLASSARAGFPNSICPLVEPPSTDDVARAESSKDPKLLRRVRAAGRKQDTLPRLSLCFVFNNASLTSEPFVALKTKDAQRLWKAGKQLKEG